jgi:hypothetical protein
MRKDVHILLSKKASTMALRLLEEGKGGREDAVEGVGRRRETGRDSTVSEVRLYALLRDGKIWWAVIWWQVVHVGTVDSKLDDMLQNVCTRYLDSSHITAVKEARPT